MDELLDKNLGILDERFPGIKKEIEDNCERLLQEEQLEVSLELNFEGKEILKVFTGEKTFYLGGKRNAVMPAANQLSVLGKIENSAPIFMVGMGNRYYLEELMKATSQNNVVMIYEPSFSIFYKQLMHLDLKELFGKRIIVLLIGGLNDSEVKPLMQNMLQGDRVPIMKNFVLPNYEKICLEKVLYFQKELSELARDYRGNLGTHRQFSGVFAENVFHNANYVRTGYKASQLISVLPRDIPAIIVSAGPSLNKNIKFLKKAKNKAFIVAVDTALKPLVKEGIIPDLFAIIDGLKPLELVRVEECRNVPMASTVNAASAVLDYHQGKKFFFSQGYSFIDKMYQLNKKPFELLPMGGSVATMTMSLVSHIGFSRVILVGQDLAFTGNKTHADGTFKEKMEKRDTSKCIMVPGNCEDMVPTAPNFDRFRRWFEGYIKEWKEKHDFLVINATEGGARIEGTEVMTLEEALEQECKKEVDIASCFDRLEPVFDEEEQKIILEYFLDTPKEFHKIAELAQYGENIYKKLGRLCANHNSDQKAYRKLLKQIKKNVKRIESIPEYQFVIESLVVADQILKAGQHLGYQSFEEECKGIAERGIKFMGLVRECAELLENYSRETFDKLL